MATNAVNSTFWWHNTTDTATAWSQGKWKDGDDYYHGQVSNTTARKTIFHIRVKPDTDKVITNIYFRCGWVGQNGGDANIKLYAKPYNSLANAKAAWTAPRTTNTGYAGFEGSVTNNPDSTGYYVNIPITPSSNITSQTDYYLLMHTNRNNDNGGLMQIWNGGGNLESPPKVLIKQADKKFTYTLGTATGANTAGSTASGSYVKGTTITLKGAANTGYTWVQWTSNKTGTIANLGATSGSFAMPNTEIKMTPKVVINSATVYYWMGGANMKSSTYKSDAGVNKAGTYLLYSNGTYVTHTVNYGASITLKSASDFGLYKTGHTFSCWSPYHSDGSHGSSLSGGGSYNASNFTDFSSKKNTSKMQSPTCYLDAVWTPNYVRFAYNPNGGTVTNTSYYDTNQYGFVTKDGTWAFQTLNYGSSDDPYNIATFGLTKKGYRANGWNSYVNGSPSGNFFHENTSKNSWDYHGNTGTGVTVNNTQIVNCYLYANWVANRSTISYDCYNTGATISSSDYYFDNSYKRICSTTKTNKEIMSTPNVFYHTVTYDSTATTKTFASFGLIPPTGYYFSSWKSGDTGEFLNEGTSYSYDKYSSDTTHDSPCWLTAQFSPKQLIITFNKNDGSGATANQTVTYGTANQAFGKYPNGAYLWGNTGQFGQWDRPGYKLLGWSLNSAATTQSWTPYSGIIDSWIEGKTAVNTPKNYVTLYAIWEPLGLVRIWNGSSYQYATPYIYVNSSVGWQQAMGYIYKNSTDKWQFGV